MTYYNQPKYLTTEMGNNAINFQERKNIGSDGRLRVPPMIDGSLEDVKLLETDIAYEYISDKGRLISSFGLDSLVHVERGGKDLYIMDNHNHALYSRWHAYANGRLERGSPMIHIDQHSDLNEVTNSNNKQKIVKNSTLEDVAIYTNEILDIASFIKPAKACGLLSDYEMILTEYSLLQYQLSTLNSQRSTIVDIDLDFRAPEMGIEHYYQTIKIVRKILSLPNVRCITVATSPTYIHQQRALEVLGDILDSRIGPAPLL